MPPRYAYWTIIVDEQPTAFRAASQEDLMPTFKRLKEKQASAKMMWFQNGKLWPSRVDAQEAMRARGEAGRRGDKRQGGLPAEARRAKVGGFRSRNDRRPSVGAREHGEKLEWKPKGSASESREKLDWKPKGTFAREDRESRDKLEWKPRGEAPSPKPQAPRSGRDKNWRPGGEHRDPRQKYKDAKKAKWTRFKQSVRKRWESKQQGKPPAKKRRDDE